jgi:hypothetical protein
MLSQLSLVADLLMIVASCGAAIYCLILSRRLSRLTSFDKGIGGAIAVLSAQVDEMKAALAEAKSGTEGAGRQLRDLVGQAQEISGELELMIAACHDFAEQALVVQGSPAPTLTPSLAPDPVAPPLPIPEVDPVSRSLPADPDGLAPSDPPEAAPIIFGTRRQTAPEPVFRRRAQA